MMPKVPRHLLSPDELEKLRESQRLYAAKWREKNREKVNQIAAKWRENNLEDVRKRDREKKRELRKANAPYAQRVRKSARSEKSKAWKRKWRKNSEQREKDRKHSKKYRQNPLNKSKEKARSAVLLALKKGILKRPEICELCGKNPGNGSDGRSLVRADHYFGYKKENWLKVRWICVECDGKSQRKF